MTYTPVNYVEVYRDALNNLYSAVAFPPRGASPYDAFIKAISAIQDLDKHLQSLPRPEREEFLSSMTLKDYIQIKALFFLTEKHGDSDYSESLNHYQALPEEPNPNEYFKKYKKYKKDDELEPTLLNTLEQHIQKIEKRNSPKDISNLKQAIGDFCKAEEEIRKLRNKRGLSSIAFPIGYADTKIKGALNKAIGPSIRQSIYFNVLLEDLDNSKKEIYKELSEAKKDLPAGGKFAELKALINKVLDAIGVRTLSEKVKDVTKSQKQAWTVRQEKEIGKLSI
ncbi:MAG: hypothetical protein KKE11_05720 [Gammaproteobacteria bacterium]|nr:hypothetical protein [Gammaproteobacteria bacterium]